MLGFPIITSCFVGNKLKLKNYKTDEKYSWWIRFSQTRELTNLQNLRKEINAIKETI